MIKSLASIKNIKEASLIAGYNFDIIDIKNIDDGPLGYAGNEEVELISNKRVYFPQTSGQRATGCPLYIAQCAATCPG